MKEIKLKPFFFILLIIFLLSGCDKEKIQEKEINNAEKLFNDSLNINILNDTIFILHIDSSINAGINYLKKKQKFFGYWDSFFCKDKGFNKERHHAPPIFPTIVILSNLKESSFDELFFKKGLLYILKVKEESLFLWSVFGNVKHQHQYYNEVFKPNCFVDPDIQTTVLAIKLLKTFVSFNKDKFNEELLLFEKQKNNIGLYSSYLTNYYKENSCTDYDYRNAPSLGVNLDLLYFFDENNIDMSQLSSAIFAEVDDSSFWASAIYWKSLPVLSLFAANASESGSEIAYSLCKRFIEDFETSCDSFCIISLNDVELASYIKATITVQKVDNTNRLDRFLFVLVRELLKRQNEDGSWKAEALYEAGYMQDNKTDEERSESFGYFGSEAETTAIAINALYSFKKTVENIYK